MSTGPTMGELTEFIREHLPRGFSLKIRFAAWEMISVYLYNHVRKVVLMRDGDPDDLAAMVVGQVNAAREMDGLEPVEGAWGRS